MAHRDRVEPHERGVLRLEHVALDQLAADRVRTIEHDEGYIFLSRRLHRQRHRRDVGVVTGADVLDVEQQDLDAGEHLGRGLQRVAVQRVDR